jgi:tetratricopeptide (TPR) repeat protein
MRDMPERHQSVRATFEHSWRLLTPSEQDTFLRLSVFHGFQPAAAHEVVGATPIMLESLSSKSLLRLLPSGRHEMHELLRQYAAEKLAARPETQTQAFDRHCAHYAAFLQQQESRLTRSSMAATLAAIRSEIGNIHAAWRWAVTQARWEEIERSLNGLAFLYRFTGPFQEAETLIQMAVDRISASAADAERPKKKVQIVLSRLLAEQARFLDEQGLHEQAIAAAQATVNAAQVCQATESEAAGRLRWGTALLEQGNNTEAQLQLEQALAIAQDTSLHQVEAHCLRSLGDISTTGGDYTQAKAYYERSLGISREFGDPWGEGSALNNIGNVALQQGDYAEARVYYEQALQICREIGDRLREAITLINLALVLHHLGDYTQAGIHYQEALQVSREIGNRRAEGYALTNWANAAFEQGNYVEARTWLRQALRICRETGNRLLESLVLNSLGLVHTYLGDYASAQAYFEPGLNVCREIGERRSEGMVLSSLSLYSLRLGDNQAAYEYGQQALHIAQELGERRLMGYVWCRLGYALVGLGRLAEAADAYGQALTLRREMGQPNLAMEPLAGLAHVALAQGDLPQARNHVAEILNYLETGTLGGTDEPCQVYLTCYRVLRAAQENVLAQAALNKAHDLLQERAAKISDEGLRRSFLENVAVHREIAEVATPHTRTISS